MTDFGPAWSRIPDPRTPDLEAFPLFAKARSVDVTLNPREILYLPARWAQFVLNLEVSVMVNFWHEPSTYNLLRKRAWSLRLRIQGRIGRG